MEIFHANGQDKKAGVAILISDKINFKMKSTVRNKERHYIIIKGTIQQEDIILVNIYAPNIRAPKYVKQILMGIKGEIERNTVIVKDFNIPLTSMDRSSRQKINKETAALNDMLEIDIFRAFHPKAPKYTYFSSSHRTFSRIDHMLGHKTISMNLRRLESYQPSSLTTII